MTIRLPWGQHSIEVELPRTWTLVDPKKSPETLDAAEDEDVVVRGALTRPVASDPLRAMPLADKNILIVTDDNTRPTPVSRFLHLVLDDLNAAGADFERICLLPALGIHTPMTEEQMCAKVGMENLKHIRWRNHDAFNEGEMHDFGRTRRGTPVRLNRAIVDADLVISIGLIEPHLWAGFGGGLKNILPGLASAHTISRHHSIIAEPPFRFNRVGMEPDENSFRLDLEEIWRLIPARIFCLNVSLDHNGRIIGAFAGDPVAAHRKGVEFNRRLSGRYVDRPVDGVIVNSFPMDFNFKQSMKCVGNSLPALKPGGVVMGFLYAFNGIDDIVLPEKSSPLWLARRILRMIGPARVMWLLEKTRPEARGEEKFLIYYTMQLIRQYDLFFYVPALSDEEVKCLGFFRRFPSPQTVIDEGRRKLGRNATVAVFPEGGATFPIIRT